MKKLAIKLAILILGIALGAGGMSVYSGGNANNANLAPPASAGTDESYNPYSQPPGGPNGSLATPPGAPGNIPQKPDNMGQGRAYPNPGNMPPEARIPAEIRVKGKVERIVGSGRQKSVVFRIEQVQESRPIDGPPSGGPGQNGEPYSNEGLRPPLVAGQTLEVRIGPWIKTKITVGSYMAVLRVLGSAQTGGPPPIALQLEKISQSKKKTNIY